MLLVELVPNNQSVTQPAKQLGQWAAHTMEGWTSGKQMISDHNWSMRWGVFPQSALYLDMAGLGETLTLALVELGVEGRRLYRVQVLG